MTEEQRQAWNEAVAAAEADPSEANQSRVESMRRGILDGIHAGIMTEDRYQEHTH